VTADRRTARARRTLLLLAGAFALGLVLLTPGPAQARPAGSNPFQASAFQADAVHADTVHTGTVHAVALRAAPTPPAPPTSPSVQGSAVTVGLPGTPSSVVTIIALTTLLGVAPAILLMCTAFTKIVVVLSLTRSAIGTMSIPPNQVLVGLALFLSLFVMGPTFDSMQTEGIKPYLDGTKTTQQAYTDGIVPLRAFMLKHTRAEELALMTKAAGKPLPKDPSATDLRTLIPAFVLSELRGAFIIGFVIFVPFLVVDIVVSAILMSLGMVMLPPSLVSLPFKLLLFVLVDGWSLIVTTLLGSYH